MTYEMLENVRSQCDEVHRASYEMCEAGYRLMRTLVELGDTMEGRYGLPELARRCHEQLNRNEQLMRSCEETCNGLRRLLEELMTIDPLVGPADLR